MPPRRSPHRGWRRSSRGTRREPWIRGIRPLKDRHDLGCLLQCRVLRELHLSNGPNLLDVVERANRDHSHGDAAVTGRESSKRPLPNKPVSMHRTDRGSGLRILEDLLGPLLGFAERGPVQSPLAREPVNTQQDACTQTGQPLRSLGSHPVVHREHAVRCSTKAFTDLGGTQHPDILDHSRGRRIQVSSRVRDPQSRFLPRICHAWTPIRPLTCANATDQ